MTSVVNGLAFNALIGALADHASTLGVVDVVQEHQVVTPPGPGITCAIWLQAVKPARGASGLDTTSMLLTFNVRLYKPITALPPDQIDPALVDAQYQIMNAYSTAFTLGGLVREVDLLGRFGDGMASIAAYMSIADAQYRIITISVPLLVDNVFGQAP